MACVSNMTGKLSNLLFSTNACITQLGSKCFLLVICRKVPNSFLLSVKTCLSIVSGIRGSLVLRDFTIIIIIINNNICV